MKCPGYAMRRMNPAPAASGATAREVIAMARRKPVALVATIELKSRLNGLAATKSACADWSVAERSGKI
jgi:hypothetical protein